MYRKILLKITIIWKFYYDFWFRVKSIISLHVVVSPSVLHSKLDRLVARPFCINLYKFLKSIPYPLWPYTLFSLMPLFLIFSNNFRNLISSNDILKFATMLSVTSDHPLPKIFPTNTKILELINRCISLPFIYSSTRWLGFFLSCMSFYKNCQSRTNLVGFDYKRTTSLSRSDSGFPMNIKWNKVLLVESNSEW